MKTRAKLLRKLQRRGKFEWEGNGADFFTPKHVRWATRWDGPGGKRPWWIYPANDLFHKDSSGRLKDKDGKIIPDAEGEDAGLELSQREKIWKAQMEMMRKRIETDPYEAIFGKRFEPFWSPLVPSWMREEMGLPVWKAKSTPEAAEPASKPNTEMEKNQVKKTDPIAQKATSTTPETPKKPEQKPVATSDIKPEAPKATSYSYASSTSWDSWSNKTRRVEWDSVSGQTKKFEYDPISNRMVLVEAPKAAETKSIESTPASTKVEEPKKSNDVVNIPVKQSSELRKSIPIPPPLSQPSRSIPIGFSATTTSTSVGPWKSTAIASDVPKNTAIATGAPKPSALATTSTSENAEQTSKPKDAGLESLTADDVRANMAKPRSQPMEPQSKDQTKTSVKTQVDALLSERHVSGGLPIRAKLANLPAVKESEWDKAELNVFYDKEIESLNKKKEKLLNDERGLFHIERQKRELMKLDTRLKELVTKVEDLNESRNTPTVEAARTPFVALQSSLDRMQSKAAPQPAVQSEDADDSAAHESTEPIVSNTSSVPRDWAKQAELLQADRVRRSAVARGLYPLSLKSTETKMPVSAVTPADIAAHKKANEARRAADEAKAAEEIAKIKAEKARLEKEQKLEKANSMLEAEVKEQKFLMQAHENRYAHKIRALRGELEIAYKQSAVHGEKHLEHIRQLEAELKTNAAAETVSKERENKFTQKIKHLRIELDNAYKQSAVHGEKHVERIRALEAELEKAQKAIGEKTKTGIETSQAEGDLAKGVTNWYQQATAKSEGEKSKAQKKAERKAKDQELVKEIQSIYEKQYGAIDAKHQMVALEKAAGAKSQVVEVESDVDLGEALAKYEKEHDGSYHSKGIGMHGQAAARQREISQDAKLNDALAKYDKKQVPVDHAKETSLLLQDLKQKGEEIKEHMATAARLRSADAALSKAAKGHEGLSHVVGRAVFDGLFQKQLQAAKEREANEGVKLLDPELARFEEEPKNLTPKELKMREQALDEQDRISEQEVNASVKSMEHLITRSLIDRAAAKSSASVAEETHGVQWAAPPVYKVLAYDSGNDMMSTATTTSNFTGTETPISIPEALSQLYAPARFVGAFADLQKDGYQVIYGTKDLLVFRKVAESPAAEVEPVKPALEDHGLMAGGRALPTSSGNLSKGSFAGINPVDGTSATQTDYRASAIDDLSTLTYKRSDGTTVTRALTPKSTLPDESHNVFDTETDWRHYPRVKREEYPVFTGTRRKWRQLRSALPATERLTRSEKKEHKRERVRRRRAVWKSIIGTGVVGAGVAYFVGAAAEKSRKSDGGRGGDEWVRKVHSQKKEPEISRWMWK